MALSAEQIKDRILYFLKVKGPSLPVHLAAEAKQSILFTSAFLSELVEDKKIKMSIMRVGSSPVYYLPGQEAELERFAEHLKSKEKEAYELLKEKKFLPDSEQQPAIRVALRGIKDFALPFKSEEQVIWRYFTVPESDFNAKKEVVPQPVAVIEPVVEQVQAPTEIKEVNEEPEKEVLEKPKKAKAKVKKKPKIDLGKKDKFLDRIKEFLADKSMELRDIESFTKNEVVLRIAEDNNEKILVAYNKKKLTDTDMIKAHKRASSLGLPYVLLGMSEPNKKTSDLINAVKGLSSIHGIK